MLISILKEFTKGRDLVRPAMTRFATAYLTLSCLMEHKGEFMAMFSSPKWKRSKFVRTDEGKVVQNIVLDSRFWSNVVMCLRAALPLVKVLRMVDSDEEPAMPFLYEEMDCAKEKIQSNYNNVKRSYEPIWKIIDERWTNQLHKPLHAAAHYLNPRVHFRENFNPNDREVKNGLFDCIEKLMKDRLERMSIYQQLDTFHHRRGMFGREGSKEMLEKKHPADWWNTYGDDVAELQKFAIRVLSLTCSSSGCERNWSAFEMIHTRKRNRLHQKKMNDLVYVMYNSKLKDKKFRNVEKQFEEVNSDEEWITERGANLDEEDDDVDVEVEVGSDALGGEGHVINLTLRDDDDDDMNFLDASDHEVASEGEEREENVEIIEEEEDDEGNDEDEDDNALDLEGNFNPDDLS